MKETTRIKPPTTDANQGDRLAKTNGHKLRERARDLDSAQERFQEAVKTSEAKFAAAFNASPAAMTIVRASDRSIVDVNDTFVDVYGFTRDEVIGKSVRELGLLADPADREKMERELVEQGRIRNMELRLTTRSGEVREVIGSSEIAEIDGETCVISLFYDVTDRVRTEAELARAEEKYRSIFESAVFGIFQTTRDGRFVSANNAMARILGYDIGAELIEAVSDIAHDIHVVPERRAELAAELEGNGEVHDFRCELRRKDGSTIHASLSGRAIRDASGEISGYEGIVQDISERKASEEALRESEHRYRELVEGLGVAVYTTDAEGRILLYNEAAVDLWGRAPIVGEEKWCGSVRLFHADGTPMDHEECPMAQTLKQNAPIRGKEAMLERPDGTRRHFVPFPTPIRDASGSLIGAVNVLVDITDRRRAEAELERRYTELETIHSLTMAVNTAVSEEDLRGTTTREAIDAVMTTIHPDRAALLLTDADGVMRFKSWVGLSEKYREAVTGHSPWTPEERDPQPVLIEDVEADPSLGELRDVVVGEGIGALAFIPLMGSGRIIGKFMLYYDSAHIFAPEEIQLAQTLASNLGLALARKLAEEERQRTLDELELERLRVDGVIADLPGVVWEAYGRPDSASQRIDFVSEYIEGLTGYTTEEWLSTPNFWLTIVHPDDRERAAAESAAIFNSKKGGRNEFRWVAKDGRVIWVEAQSTVILDESGEPVGMRGVTMDITVRKEAEEAVRAAEAQLNIVADAVPALISYVDQRHRYAYVNRGYEDWFGHEPGETIGKHMRDVVGARAYKKIRPYVLRAMSGEHVQYETEVPYAEGGTRWVHAEYIPHRSYGKVVGFVALVMDISDRKKADDEEERTLKETERRLNEEGAINRVAELLRTTLDLETLCQVALSQAAAVLGVEFGMIAVRSGDQSHLVSTVGLVDNSLEPFRELGPENPTALARALYGGRAAFSPRGRLLTGSAAFMRTSGATRFAVVPLIARGAIVGAMEVASRSGTKWSQQDRKFIRRLADHIALAVSNAQAYQSIEEAYKRRDEGVRALSHEIRTPLTALKGFSQLALRHLERGSADPERLKDSLEEIAAASDRLVRVAEQMLSASTVESGIARMHKERVTLGSFLRQAILEFNVDERPCPVRLAPAPRALLYIDPQLIRQVLWNLLGNAMKYNPPGEPILVQATRAENLAKITVIDKGPGVPQADVARLFEKFHKGTDSQGGLGLGLFLAREVVEAHGGAMSYQPEEGGGSRFSFTLPIRRFRP
jgi:PAS domain S-box-containing protein